MLRRLQIGVVVTSLAVAALVFPGIVSPVTAATVSVNAVISPFVTASPSSEGLLVHANDAWVLKAVNGDGTRVLLEGGPTGSAGVFVPGVGDGFTLELQ